MAKYLILAILLIGCWPECELGEVEICHCSNGSYSNYCTVDGFYLECDCGIGGGGIDQGGTMSGGDQEGLNQQFPPDYPVPICESGEVGIPGTTLCWRICPVGSDWTGHECTGYPRYDWSDLILSACEEYDSDYRFPTLEEVAYLLNHCNPNTFDYWATNFCGPYLLNPIRYTMQLPNDSMMFIAWVDNVWCGIGDIEGYHCSWYTTFHTTSTTDTEFDLLLSTGTVNGAMASGICVRSI